MSETLGFHIVEGYRRPREIYTIRDALKINATDAKCGAIVFVSPQTSGDETDYRIS